MVNDIANWTCFRGKNAAYKEIGNRDIRGPKTFGLTRPVKALKMSLCGKMWEDVALIEKT